MLRDGAYLNQVFFAQIGEYLVQNLVRDALESHDEVVQIDREREERV